MAVVFEKINPDDNAFCPWRQNFIIVDPACRCKNMEEAYNRDIELRDAYVGRELLEMMQNADDQNSSVLEFGLDRKACVLTIINSGKQTKPFSKEGFECLIRANTSEKRVLGNSAIGHKGCGFRSLLNWAEEIRIHSNHVVFTFSKDARDKAWTEICEKTDPDFEREKEKLLEKMAKAYKGVTIPLSIMATPARASERPEDGPSWTEADGWITSIRIKFNPCKLDEIQKQLNDITPESLLFVRNLRTVRVSENEDGKIVKVLRDLSCEKKDGYGSLGHGVAVRKVELKDGDETSIWCKGERQEGENEIVVAWREDRRPVPLKSRVAYTYFPTTFQLSWLPCILHATFDLDPSRNGINKSQANIELMRVCGEFVAQISVDIAEKTDWANAFTDDQVWFPFDMLNVGEIAGNDDLRLAFKEGVRCGTEEGVVYPVTSRQYVSKDNYVCYSLSLANFLVEKGVEDCFRKHIWCSYDSRRIAPALDNSLAADADALLKKFLSELADSPDPLSKESFVGYIKALEIVLGIRRTLAKDLCVSCLPDLENRMIPKTVTGFVNCGEMLEGAADCLDIHYVNRNFVECYHDTGLIAKSEWNNGRGLVARLSGFCKCSSSDINPMKELLVGRSIEGYNDARGDGYGPKDCFVEVVKSLYCLYKRSPSQRMSLYFHVLCEDGHVRQASDACLWDEAIAFGVSAILPNLEIDNKWRMKGSLEFWQKELGAEDADTKNAILNFFHNFLGVSLGFPCIVKYCSRWDNGQYLASQCETAEAYFDVKQHYFNDWDLSNVRPEVFNTNSQYEANSLYGLDAEFIHNLLVKYTAIEVFSAVLRDPALCGRITYKPIVHASYYGDKTCTFRQSYLAYSMKEMEWVRTLSKDEIEQKVKDWDVESRRRAREVLRALRVFREVEDLTVEEIYEQLAEKSKKNDSKGIQSFYSRARMAIRKRIEQGLAQEDQCSQLAKQKLDKLFARVRNDQTGTSMLTLVKREEIRYWDNALVSRSLLESLPKLEIGARVGAPSVEALFGVRQLRSEDVVVLDSVKAAVNTELSDAVNARLRKLRKYILAVRFRDEWREDIEVEAKRCKTFEVKIVSPMASAFYLKDVNGGDGGTRYRLAEGDLLQDTGSGVYWICTSSPTVDALWSKRSFRTSVVEALCIHFRLTGTQIESAFHEVLRNDESENEEFRSRMMADEQWRRLEKALGLSDDERVFWKTVAKRAGKEISDEDLETISFENGNWKSVLKGWFGVQVLPEEFESVSDFSKMEPVDIIAIARWAKIPPSDLPRPTADRIKEYVSSKLDELKAFKAVGTFAVKLHESLKQQSKDKHRQYVPLLHQFMEQPIADVESQFMSCNEFPADVEQRIKQLLFDAVEKKFSIRMSELTEQREPAPCKEYDDILTKRDLNSLSYEDLSLVYFEGNKESLLAAFNKIEQKHIAAEEPTLKDPNGAESVEEQMLDADDLKDIVSAANAKKSGVMSHPGGSDYDTDKLKHARGEKAEDVVENMLRRWKTTGKCLQYGARSTISNVTGTANDGAHFDFWYETSLHEIRLIEVKSYSGSRVIMSSGEYGKATSEQWRKKYDLVLVMDGKPYVMEGPLFGDDSKFKDSIGREVESYSLRIELKSNQGNKSQDE